MFQKSRLSSEKMIDILEIDKNKLSLDKVSEIYKKYGIDIHEYKELKDENLFQFVNTKVSYEYLNSAIALNIQHSLETERGGKLFYDLHELHEKNLLRGIINRIVEREGHHLILETIQNDFFPHDLEDGIRNIVKDTHRNFPDNFLNRIDLGKLVAELMHSLEITNDRVLQTVTATKLQRLKDYLYTLDLFVPDSTYIISLRPDGSPICFKDFDANICVQSGLRYNHAKTLVEKLSYDQYFNTLKERQKQNLTQMFLDMAKGRILEEIIRHETRIALKKYKNISVYKLEFNGEEKVRRGEYDMLIYNSEKNTCQIYEIKHSKHQSKRQKHWLIHQANNQLTEYFFGPITSRTVIYIGQNVSGPINYLNASDYLLNIESYIFDHEHV